MKKVKKTKKVSKSSTRKIEKAFRKAVHKAVKNGTGQTINAPSHMVSGAVGHREGEYPPQVEGQIEDLLFDNSIVDIGGPLDPVDSTSEGVKGLLAAGNLLATLDTSVQKLEEAKKAVKAIYGIATQSQEDLGLKIDTIVGMIEDIRKSVAPTLRKHVAKHVKTLVKQDAKYFEQKEVLRVVR